jgi:hypothetical protein
MGRNTATGAPVELPITDGKLDVNASVSAPEGGATSAKQDEQTVYLDSIEGKLPALGQALAAASIPVVLPAAQITSLTAPVLATGSNTIGAVTGPAAAALALDATLSTLSAKIPAAASLSGTLSTPTAPILGALTCGYSSALGRPLVTPVDSTGIASVIARKHSPGSRSGSTSLQIQRTIAAFSCTPVVVRAWSSTAGYIALANASSAVADGFTPYGGHVYAIEAGRNLTIEWEFRETYTTGLVVVFCTQIFSGASLATVIGTTNCCLFTGQYD